MSHPGRIAFYKWLQLGDVVAETQSWGQQITGPQVKTSPHSNYAAIVEVGSSSWTALKCTSTLYGQSTETVYQFGRRVRSFSSNLGRVAGVGIGLRTNMGTATIIENETNDTGILASSISPGASVRFEHENASLIFGQGEWVFLVDPTNHTWEFAQIEYRTIASNVLAFLKDVNGHYASGSGLICRWEYRLENAWLSGSIDVPAGYDFASASIGIPFEFQSVSEFQQRQPFDDPPDPPVIAPPVGALFFPPTQVLVAAVA